MRFFSSMRVVAADLACERSGRPVFRGLSFSVGSGEGLVLTGRNGAGKSSLLMMLAGQIVPASGRLAVEGAPSEKTLPELAHYIGHRDALKPSLTPLESLAFWQAMLGHAARAPRDALDRLGLGHAGDLPCAYLSAGQRRRLALARLLVSSRPVWLLDEPTAALDAASQRLFDDLVDEHLASGGRAIAATHVPLGFRTATRLAIGGGP